jgi:D-alanyl-lipoteichoic acid acyltransferase DltB (MBOAT superfamily)
MKLNKIFKWGMVVLILVSVAILVWGFSSGFATPDKVALPATNVLLTWAAIMIGIALFCWIVIGLIISVKNDPKSIIKMGIVLVGIAVVCLLAYLLAKGDPVPGAAVTATSGELKLTDTILNLTLIAGVGAIAAIIIGEIRLAIANKK